VLYELPSSDRPDDDLFQDDAKLDRWFDSFLKDLQRKSGKKAGDPKYALGMPGKG